jgi:hypothetical protein
LPCGGYSGRLSRGRSDSGLRSNRKKSDELKKKNPPKRAFQKLKLQEQRCENPTLAESGNGRKRFCGGFVRPDRADLIPPSHRKAVLVHTVRIYSRTQALQGFPPDSRGRRPLRGMSFAVARLLPNDSCYTVFQWSDPIPDGTNVFTTV